MQPEALLHAGLKDNLRALLSGNHSRRQLDAVLKIAHAFACTFLASKRSAWLLTSRHEFTLPDLAYDCIAELFQQDDSRTYPQLNAYFEALPFESMSDSELLPHLRRLVFSKVNHGVFRVFSEIDPSLGKVLRNIKIAVQTLNHYREVERFGESYLVPGLCETLDHLRGPDTADIERLLRATRGRAQHIPDLLARLSVGLREQNQHSRLVPLVTLGMVIRNLFAPESPLIAEPESEHQMVIEDTARIVRQACTRIQTTMHCKYVGKGKVNEQTFCAYFTVLEQSIVQRLVGTDGEECSYYKLLKAAMGDLSTDEYQKLHKSQLEYLGRIVFDEAAKQIKADRAGHK